MSKLKRSQILVLSLLAALLIVTPLIPSSLRPKYLYFIFNLLIIALGAEAGLISAAFSKPVVPLTTKPARSSVTAPPDHQASTADQADEAPAKAKVFEKSASENYGSTVIRVDRIVKKCPSLPSLFFIGGGDHGAEAVEDVRGGHEEEEGGRRSWWNKWARVIHKSRDIHWQLLQAAEDAKGRVLEEDSWVLSQGFLRAAASNCIYIYIYIK
ncbi:hypothetical protein OIU74_006393 [Salix koriyanagi]|uniref:DUF4408 domain-containing protein n=1 Tax=Salix koriyanagi TaxID=2511006 RepID=A0A9Q0ZBJ3_9ROSI|nr:hypothetical protein OIU74_006393 [Salix koriyanagi]